MKTETIPTETNQPSTNLMYPLVGFALFSIFASSTLAANTSDLAKAVLNYGKPVKSQIIGIEAPFKKDDIRKSWEFIDEELFLKAFETRCWKGGKKTSKDLAASC